ncbi:hypothetical protein TRICI_006359 [Trichomonascus ciferrii]|uniref:Metallo-beta-lactamase domain-containing protein n=1 Tax=Trichomonascus ciferrii TaxID=44093 RepID=A0A642ULW5_9ASCO|nr:hypothetical protein TRICI_006359 [Trichomonascus ciferrii]
MHSSNFKSSFSVTHIGTATAILEIEGLSFVTDPFFSPPGTKWDLGDVELVNTESLPLDSISFPQLMPFSLAMRTIPTI